MEGRVGLKMVEESPKNVDGKLLQLPLARIKMIMKSSPEIGNVSQEGYFLIARSAELFAQYFAEQGFKSGNGMNELNYQGLASSVESNDSLDFLGDIVPHKITMSEYWKTNPVTTEDDKDSTKMSKP